MALRCLQIAGQELFLLLRHGNFRVGFLQGFLVEKVLFVPEQDVHAGPSHTEDVPSVLIDVALNQASKAVWVAFAGVSCWNAFLLRLESISLRSKSKSLTWSKSSCSNPWVRSGNFS